MRLSKNQPKTETDPFEEIDFGSFFDDYLDPALRALLPNPSKSRPSRRFFLIPSA